MLGEQGFAAPVEPGHALFKEGAADPSTSAHSGRWN